MSNTDTITNALVARFAATLDGCLSAPAQGVAPLGIHWCLAPPAVPTRALRPDGHPPRGSGVSVAAFPRRMWVGGSIAFEGTLRVGDTVARATIHRAPVRKEGRRGAMVLAAEDHDYLVDGRPVVRERRDVAYRGPGGAAPAMIEHATADLGWSLATDPALLFRYSALTFNAHRIHYDLSYAVEEEGYAGLLVHGPLQATVLLNLAATLIGACPRRFAYRAVSPMIAGAVLVAKGRRTESGATLWCGTDGGAVTMRAEATG